MVDLHPRHRTASTGSPLSSYLMLSGKVLATLLSAALLVGLAYAHQIYGDLNGHINRLVITAIDHEHTANGKPTKDIDGTDQNILIVGNDDRTDMTNAEVRALHTGRDGGSINTDSMMIVHVPADGSKATLISLPRDSYVQIPGYRTSKLNAAYPDGYTYTSGNDVAKRAAGADELIKTVQKLTGLSIDHFVQVDLIGFYRISEAIGPVTVNMCEAVNEPKSNLHLPAGKSSIVGRQALAFVRQRYDVPGGDLGREQRQRYFLTAAFRAITSARTLVDPSRLKKLVNAVDQSVYVDSGFSIQSLADQLIDLSANNIIGKTIPVDGGAVIDGQDVLQVDPAKVKVFVHRLIDGPSHHAASTTPKPSSSTTSHAPIDSGCIH